MGGKGAGECADRRPGPIYAHPSVLGRAPRPRGLGEIFRSTDRPFPRTAATRTVSHTYSWCMDGPNHTCRHQYMQKKIVVKSQVTRTPRSSRSTKGVHEVFYPYRNPATFPQRLNISTDAFQSRDAAVRILDGSSSARFRSPATEECQSCGAKHPSGAIGG